MRFHSATILAALVAAMLSVTARATVIDDFSNPATISNYTQDVLLDQQNGGGGNQITFSAPSGYLQETETNSSSNNVIQVSFLRSDYTLDVGEELKADVVSPATSSEDFAIMVAASTTEPISALSSGTGRADYIIASYRTSAAHFVGGGFGGTSTGQTPPSGGAISTTAISTVQVQSPTVINITSLFIRRDSANTFEVGYDSDDGPDVSVSTFTMADSTIGNAVGFYVDGRSSGTFGGLDNLRIEPAPEPASLGVLTLGALGLLARRRR